MIRTRIVFGIGLAVLVGVAALPAASFAAIQYFVEEGPGLTDVHTGLNSPNCPPSGLPCNTGDVCQCAESKGTLTGTLGGLNGGTFVFDLSIDVSHSFNNGSNNACFFATGLVTMTGTTPSNVLVAQTTGLACNGPAVNNGIYGGSYVVTQASNGLFFRATGSGSFSWSDQFSNGSTVIQLTGNINNGGSGATHSNRAFEFVWPPK